MVVTNASEIANLNRYQHVDNDSSVLWLEKAQSGKVSMEDIKDALDEFVKLFDAGMASKAETLTLTRAFPNSSAYAEAARKHSETDDSEPVVIGGPASVQLVDREGHLITTQALERAFKKFMHNDRTRNVMVLHSDVQVGWALPAYISKGGQIFKSGVDDKGLFFICELRDDTSIAKKVSEQIHKGMLKSYSIAGSATRTQNITKGLTPYLQVDDMELAEVTICEKGVNQGAGFELLKSEMPPSPLPPPPQIIAPVRKILMHSNNDGTINFNKSFAYWLQKDKDPLKTGESFVTLNNEGGRQAEHDQLLREYGFPSEQSFETMRYVPVVEVETDDDGIPIHNLPPWIVNEAGEALGDRLDEDAPDYDKSDKAKARKKAGSAQKMFYDFMGIKKAIRPYDPEDEDFNRRAMAARQGRAKPDRFDPYPEGEGPENRAYPANKYGGRYGQVFDPSINWQHAEPERAPRQPGDPSLPPRHRYPKGGMVDRKPDISDRVSDVTSAVRGGSQRAYRGARDLARGVTTSGQRGRFDPQSGSPISRSQRLGQFVRSGTIGAARTAKRGWDALGDDPSIADHHRSLGFGKENYIHNHAWEQLSHADQRNSYIQAKQSGEDQTVETHLNHYTHNLKYPTNDANGNLGDSIGRVSVRDLPGGVHSRTKMNHNEFRRTFLEGNNPRLQVTPNEKYKDGNWQSWVNLVNERVSDPNHNPGQLSPSEGPTAQAPKPMIQAPNPMAQASLPSPAQGGSVSPQVSQPSYVPDPSRQQRNVGPYELAIQNSLNQNVITLAKAFGVRNDVNR